MLYYDTYHYYYYYYCYYCYCILYKLMYVIRYTQVPQLQTPLFGNGPGKAQPP